ncbi:MAG: hypothetical protein RBS68_04680 [Anaerolineales bacterium]|jgi:hypothetical protein|nr:hypothetical protein [Anaerolineales bacterium]
MFRSARFFLAVFMLLLASLACQAVTGGGLAPAEESRPEPTRSDESLPATLEPTPIKPPAASKPDLGFETEFPLPEDANTAFNFGDGISFQTGLSLEETLVFYRDAFGAQGYVEREILTSVTESVLSLVFDGHESGKAIVLQAVDLGGGTVNVTLRFEDI